MASTQARHLTGPRVELKRGFFHGWDEFPVVETDIMPGVLRQSVANENLMLSRIEYLASGGVPVHAHEAQQVVIMLEGTMTATIGDETRELAAGEFAFVPGRVSHAFVSKDGCVFLEAATPTRIEYLVGYVGPANQVLNKQEGKAE